MSSLKRKAGPLGAGSDAKKAKQDGSITSFFGGPKAAASSTAGNAASKGAAAEAAFTAGPKFDKAKWAAGLTPEQRELLKLEIDTLHESWLGLLKDEIVTPEFLNLKRFLARETAANKKWFPPQEDVYSWSRYAPFNTVKVVIIGQDPYHNHNQAHGMAFSVRPPTPAPPSLKNMYTCLKNDYPSFVPPPRNGGLLTPWAERGVLMLNTCLTVRAHEANSHANRGWERFTQRVIDLVAARRARGVVFMAWGTPAGKRVQRVDAKRHLVLRSVHPSPLSASRGFFTCAHFRLANEWLVGRYGAEGEIDWALTEGTTTKSGGKAAKAEGEAPPAKVEAVVVEEKKVEAVVADEKKAEAISADEIKAMLEEAEGDENLEPEDTEA